MVGTGQHAVWVCVLCVCVYACNCVCVYSIFNELSPFQSCLCPYIPSPSGCVSKRGKRRCSYFLFYCIYLILLQTSQISRGFPTYFTPSSIIEPGSQSQKALRQNSMEKSAHLLQTVSLMWGKKLQCKNKSVGYC